MGIIGKLKLNSPISGGGIKNPLKNGEAEKRLRQTRAKNFAAMGMKEPRSPLRR